MDAIQQLGICLQAIKQAKSDANKIAQCFLGKTIFYQDAFGVKEGVVTHVMKDDLGVVVKRNNMAEHVKLENIVQGEIHDDKA